MPTLHSTLTGADLHEPKGIETAPANTVYVANGSGSGTWSSIDTLVNNAVPTPPPPSVKAYGQLITKHIRPTTLDVPYIPFVGGIDVFNPAAYKKYNLENFWYAGESSGISLDPINGEITVNSAGAYKIDYNLSFSLRGYSSTGYGDMTSVFIKYAINGIINNEYVKIITVVIEEGVHSTSDSIIKTLNAGDKISLYVVCYADGVVPASSSFTVTSL